jgi:hypothetical protein
MLVYGEKVTSMTKSIDQVRFGAAGGAAADVLLLALYDVVCVLRPARSDDKGGRESCQIKSSKHLTPA